ncbi:ABC transporter permease [Marinimicrobium sp. ABcell2]|uniref:ABC transporter permease n=1 Tax=Marinimicrobium sp. ABcell2 TaxID=3069751 RepID=UPI0027B81F1C|nr:ABC transporter permease [Marinimicrobium sp. ABcell2]MDQ2075851.1 ABC transporter permease [Marinimicrobium sp. ABcell2]
MNGLTQIITVCAMNIRNLPARLGSSAVAVFGVACVVGVFVGVLSMASGFQRTMTLAGSDDVAIIMRSGATSEMSSGLGYDEVQLLENVPGVLRQDGRPVTSAELYVVVDMPMRATNTSANVPLRGVQQGAFEVRDNIEFIEGRNFETGRNELIAGRGAHHQFANLNLGSTVRLGQSEWTVVGIFAAGNGAAESELWADASTVQSAYRRGNSFQSMRLKLDSEQAFESLVAAVASDPRLDVDVQRESTYMADQAEPLSVFIRGVGYPLAILMSLGAIFGAINTMYASVSARTREIATLRALGFGAFPVAFSTLVESILLALVGGVIGALVVFLVFNGYTVSTINGASFSQVVFDFAVTGDLLYQGMVAAVVIGFIGGLFPALRAARLPVATALRET